MDEKIMKERLVKIFDLRLKSLIGYRDSAFTEDLVHYMFKHFDRLGSQGHAGYRVVIQRYIRSILSFEPGNGSMLEGSASGSTISLLLNLENYIRSNIELFCPQWRASYRESEYRKVLGMEFDKAMRTHPSRYPSALNPRDFLPQLNYTTQMRNKFAHNETFGRSAIYPRYVILLGYEVLLSYLLYTFYCMALSPYTPENDLLKNLKN